MFKKKTVLILGAGASNECGMPLGSTLKKAVADDLNFYFEDMRIRAGDHYLFQVLRDQFGAKANDHFRAGRELAAVIPTFISIDEALHYFAERSDIVALGKLAIVFELFRAEGRSALQFRPQDGRPHVESMSGTWYAQFLSMAVAELKKSELQTAFQNITVVNFNYDRTLECYLFWALQGLGADVDLAAKIFSSLRVIRPYGCASPFSRDTRFTDERPSVAVLLNCRNGIRTYTEQHQTNVPEDISEALDECELLLVLGFGFHDQNMKLLDAKKKRNMGTHVFATVAGIDRENHESISERLRGQFNTSSDNVQVFDRAAGNLLRDLRLRILKTAQ